MCNFNSNKVANCCPLGLITNDSNSFFFLCRKVLDLIGARDVELMGSHNLELTEALDPVRALDLHMISW